MIKKFAIFVLLLSSLSFANTGAQAQQVSSGSSDAALQSLQQMSPAERNDVLQQALQSLQSMSPEERRQLVDEAKSQVQGSGGDPAAAGAAWDKLLTPEQKKMLSDQLQGQLQGQSKDTTVSDTQARAPQAGTADLLQQIQNLSPAQRQSLLNALGASAAAATAAGVQNGTPVNALQGAATGTAPAADPCAAYQNANPAFYANCESRMKPGR